MGPWPCNCRGKFIASACSDSETCEFHDGLLQLYPKRKHKCSSLDRSGTHPDPRPIEVHCDGPIRALVPGRSSQEHPSHVRFVSLFGSLVSLGLLSTPATFDSFALVLENTESRAEGG